MKEKKPVYSLIGEISQARGLVAERKVIEFFLNEENRCLFPDWLEGLDCRTNRDDTKGIDCWFLTDVGKIPLQIKSSLRGKNTALEKHPHIPVVIIHADDSEQEILEKCLTAVSESRDFYLAKRRNDD